MLFRKNRAKAQVSFALPAALFVLLLLIAGPGVAADVRLAWDPVTSPGVTGYKVHLGPAAGNYTTTIDVGNTTSHTVVNLSDGATYHFAVTAYGSGGNQSPYSNDVGYTVAYGKPIADFNASAASGPAPLSMNFVNSSTGAIATYAWTFGDGTTSTASSPAHVYFAAGVYTVTLTVTGPGGSSTKTRANYITVTGLPDTSPPTTPSSLTAAASGPGTISLRWNASTDNVGVTGYRIERCQGATCTNYAQIATSGSTTYSNTGVIAASTYRYRVRAHDAAGNLSGYSNTAGATAVSVGGLVAGLAFNETSGTSAADTTGNGHTGTLVNGPTRVTGKFGNGLSFDGVNDSVTVGNPATLNFAADFTIAVWVKRNALGGSSQRHILAKCTSSTWVSGCKELYFAGNTLRFGSYGTGDTNSISIADTNWHHIAVTFTRSTNTVAMYVDGTLRTTAVRNLEADGGSHVVTVGNMRGSNPFSGSIDEVRVYNQVLTAAQITAIMAAPL